MNVDIKQYLSENEIKQACIEAVKEHTKSKLGVNDSALATKIAFQVVKKEQQKYILNYSDTINDKIVEAINKISLGTLFFNSFGWSSDGHKLFKSLLSKHSKLLEDKLVKILK